MMFISDTFIDNYRGLIFIAMHPDNAKAIDMVDAMVFTGCTLLNKADRDSFKATLESWLREVKRFEELDSKPNTAQG